MSLFEIDDTGARWRVSPAAARPIDCIDLVPAGLPYDHRAPDTTLGVLALDPIYEAKCLPFLRDGDLLWVVGLRPSVA